MIPATAPALRPDAPSPIVLTNRELIAEADALALRIAHANLHPRDVALVQQMAVRLGRLQ